MLASNSPGNPVGRASIHLGISHGYPGTDWRPNRLWNQSSSWRGSHRAMSGKAMTSRRPMICRITKGMMPA